MAILGKRRDGERLALPSSLAREVRRQFVRFQSAALEGFTYERRRSSYTGAKDDLFFYDSAGKLAFLGRDFGSQVFMWEPTEATT